MRKLTMTDLIEFFSRIRMYEDYYIAIIVRTKGFYEDEIIINQYHDFNKKLEYYKNNYDEELNYKYVEGVKIVNFYSGGSIQEIADWIEMDKLAEYRVKYDEYMSIESVEKE